MNDPLDSKLIDRREAIRLGGLAFFVAGMAPHSWGSMSSSVSTDPWLFFPDSDLAKIRANGQSILLGPTFREWAARSPELMVERWKRFSETNNIVTDLGRFWAAFTETAVVQLIEPSVRRREALLDAVENVLQLPKWDYLMNGDEDLGLMRAAMAVSRLLFAREVLRNDVDEKWDKRFLANIAEKGALPCSLTLRDFGDPVGVTTWHNDPEQEMSSFGDLSRWPEILAANNLRGTSTMGLGMAALALLGHDERADAWVDLAAENARTTLGFFSTDGSYFEGLSYAAYVLRILLPFCEAHQRIKGTIDWSREINWNGVVDDIATLQAGYKQDGLPDVVNFSDASTSIHPCVGSWIRKRVGNEVAQYAVKHFSQPGYFLDFLWYEPDASAQVPDERLKNHHSAINWVVCRSGWRADDAVLAFRSGNPANHEHADRNSFLFKIYGERLLTDLFGAAYSSKDPKWILRLPQAHNAVLVGGRGHQYHNGEEGVNEGLAKAKILRFEDQGQRAWWCSDATHGYRLVNPNVSKIVRTMAFAKPNIILVLDEVTLAKSEEAVELRFLPDNRDGSARVSLDGSRFSIERPHATLFGQSFGDREISVSSDALDLGPDYKDEETFPFARVSSSSAATHSILTVLLASHSPAGIAPQIEVEKTNTGWTFSVRGVSGTFNITGDIPELNWI